MSRITLVVLMFVPALGITEEPSRHDSRLHGTWKAVKQKFNGGESANPDLTLTFAADGKLEKRASTYLDEGTFTTNLKAEPAELDLHVPGPMTPALYRFEGERLILAVAWSWGSKRPGDFTAPRGDYRKGIYVLEKVPAEKVRAADQDPQEMLKVLRLRVGGQVRRIVLAMHQHHDKHGTLPRPAITDQAGKPLLSWRVALLPYLGEKDLYEQFHLDEPWDSEHNRKLLARLPKVFASVGNPPKVAHGTFYQAFVGEGCLFEPGKSVSVRDVFDGTVRTIAVITSAQPVPWTKPDDLTCAENRKLPDFTGGMIEDGLLTFATADGEIHVINNVFGPDKERAFRAAITRSGGELVDWDKLRE